MKKLIAFLLTAIMLMILFSGCGSNNNSNNTQLSTVASRTGTAQTTLVATPVPVQKLSGKITFYTNMTNYVDSTLKNLAKEFMDKNPGTEIENVSVAGDTFRQRLKIEMASNEMSDITAVLPETKKADLPKYYLPLDDLGFTKDNLKFYNDGLGDDGKLYVMTSAVSYWALVYNKKVFSDCGITSVPKTLDELYADCEKIKAKGIVPLTTNFKDTWPLNAILLQTIASKSSDYQNTLANSNELLTQDGIVATLKIWTTMRDKGYLDVDLVSASWEACQRDIAQGKTAMTYLGAFAPKMFADKGAKLEDIGMFNFPGQIGTYTNKDWLFGIAKNTKNPDLAKAYFKYLWEDSRYANAIGQVSPLKGAKCSIPAVNELLSYGNPLVEHAALSDDYSAITSKAQINLPSIFQEYLLAKNPDDIVKKYNQKWADARKALGK